VPNELPLMQYSINKKQYILRDLKTIVVFMFFTFGLYTFLHDLFGSRGLTFNDFVPMLFILVACNLSVLIGTFYRIKTTGDTVICIYRDHLTNSDKTEPLVFLDVLNWIIKRDVDGNLLYIYFNQKQTYTDLVGNVFNGIYNLVLPMDKLTADKVFETFKNILGEPIIK